MDLLTCQRVVGEVGGIKHCEKRLPLKKRSFRERSIFPLKYFPLKYFNFETSELDFEVPGNQASESTHLRVTRVFFSSIIISQLR